MNFDNVKVDRKVLLDYIKTSNLNFNELAGITNLYKSYVFINDLLKKNSNQNKTLLDYENEIYTIDGKKMTEMQKIELELSRIDKKFELFKEHMSSSEIDVITEEILVLKKLFLEYSNDFDKVTLHYIKKNISLIQAKLGLKNYFLSAAFDAFMEKYMDICINKTRGLEKNMK